MGERSFNPLKALFGGKKQEIPQPLPVRPAPEKRQIEMAKFPTVDRTIEGYTNHALRMVDKVDNNGGRALVMSGHELHSSNIEPFGISSEVEGFGNLYMAMKKTKTEKSKHTPQDACATIKTGKELVIALADGISNVGENIDGTYVPRPATDSGKIAAGVLERLANRPEGTSLEEFVHSQTSEIASQFNDFVDGDTTLQAVRLTPKPEGGYIGEILIIGGVNRKGETDTGFTTVKIGDNVIPFSGTPTQTFLSSTSSKRIRAHQFDIPAGSRIALTTDPFKDVTRDANTQKPSGAALNRMINTQIRQGEPSSANALPNVMRQFTRDHEDDQTIIVLDLK